MPVGPMLAFRGREDYLRNLALLRERIPPVREYLREDRQFDDMQRGLEEADQQLQTARELANAGSIGKQVALGSARLNQLMQKGRALGQMFRLAFFPAAAETPDARELAATEAENPRTAERLKREMADRAAKLAQLRDVVDALREEPAPKTERIAWQGDFARQTGKPLSKFELYVIKHWKG